MSYGFPEVTLLAPQHEVILHDFHKMTSEPERKVISHYRAVRSMVAMVLNDIYILIKQLLTYVSVDMECY